MKGELLSAEARGLARAARSLEEGKDRDGARRLYLRAAASFVEAAKAESDPKVAGLRHDLAESFYAKAQRLQEPPKTVRFEAHGTVEEAKPVFEATPIPSVTFKDVAGMREAKTEIRKAIVYPLKRPDLYARYGREAGGGILLYGPPGCGKTHIARAAAGEVRVPFFDVRLSDVLSRWVGDNERNLQAVFDAARKAAPSILFMDEVDALARKRSSGQSAYVNRLVNALLGQIDGIGAKSRPVLVMGATNEPWSIDPAFRRPGRFTRLLYIPPPDEEARLEMLRLCNRGRPLAANLGFEPLVAPTDGYSMADLKQVCDEAADIPLFEALEGGTPRPIAMGDFEAALARRRSSLVPWLGMARKNLRSHGEEEAFPEVVALLNGRASAGSHDSGERRK